MKTIIMIYPKVGLDIKGSSIFLPLSILYPLSKFTEYNLKVIDQRIEENWKEKVRELLDKDIICVGISFMSGSQIKYGLEIIDFIKEISSKTKIFVGEVNPSLLPEQTIEEKNIDFVVIGEGEETFYDLVKSLDCGKDLRKVKGLCFKEDGKIIKTEERPFVKLENLPKELYSLINIKDYYLSWFSSKKSLSLLTGRGCPHRCAFCYNKAFNKMMWRPLETKEMIKGVKEIINLGGETIEILDDNFFTNIKRIKDFCQELKRDKIDIKFVANCRVDDLAKFDDDMLNTLRDCGFIEFYVGVESGSDKTLNKIKKDITTEQIFLADEKLRKANINPIYSFMAGFPGEEYDDIKKTIDTMLRLLEMNPNASLTGLKIFTPFPGTELYEECKKLGFKSPKTFKEWGSFNYNSIEYSWRTKKEDKLLEKLSYMTYFLDKKSFLKIINKRKIILKWLITLYSKIVLFRCKYHFYSLTPEVFLMKKLKKVI